MLQNIAKVTGALLLFWNDFLTKPKDAWTLLPLLCLGALTLVPCWGFDVPRRLPSGRRLPSLCRLRGFSRHSLSQQGCEKGKGVGLS